VPYALKDARGPRLPVAAAGAYVTSARCAATGWPCTAAPTTAPAATCSQAATTASSRRAVGCLSGGLEGCGGLKTLLSGRALARPLARRGPPRAGEARGQRKRRGCCGSLRSAIFPPLHAVSVCGSLLSVFLRAGVVRAHGHAAGQLPRPRGRGHGLLAQLRQQVRSAIADTDGCLHLASTMRCSAATWAKAVSPCPAGRQAHDTADASGAAAARCTRPCRLLASGDTSWQIRVWSLQVRCTLRPAHTP
jgi:hypothetical protein